MGTPFDEGQGDEGQADEGQADEGQGRGALVPATDLTVDRDDRTVDVVELVATAVRTGPDHAAIIDRDGTVVTYAELWAASAELADRLSIEKGEVVGVSMARSAAVVTAMLAILRAGGVYAPFSPDDPAARTSALRDRIGIRRVVVMDGSGSIVVDDDGRRARALDIGSGADRPIYVMWTSGSTGEPKAVVVPHRGVVRLVEDRSFMDLRSDDRVAFASNPMFDATTWEVWATLGNGATIVVIDRTDLVDVHRLRRRFERTGVTRAFLTTSLFDMLATRDPAMFAGLRSLAVGGEPLRPHTISAVSGSASPPGEIVNGYGPTECTTFATSHNVTADDLGRPRIPIGRPIHSTDIAIVDAGGRAVAPGDEGELWIAGDGVALGYLGTDGLEHDRFVETAFDDGVVRRWYRTGDLARVDEDGLVDCLGRIDRQVKIRGYRIEPAEVERAIARFDKVEEVAVVVERSAAVVRLHAFVVMATDARPGDGPATTEEIRAALRAELPAHLVPARITGIGALPVTANGKLDVDALLAIRPSTSDALTNGPVDPAIVPVLRRVRVVLGDPLLGPDDDLWDAGLDSLGVVELIDALDELVGRQLRPIDFVDHPTVSALAEQCAIPRTHEPTDVVVYTAGADGEPVFFVLGTGTSSLALRHLAGQLGRRGRPLVAIEPGGRHSDRRSRRRVETLADRVVLEIERRRPTGPVVLAGWSAGGVIATHATRLLELRGRVVRLMLFDTFFLVPDDPSTRSPLGVAVRYLAQRFRTGVRSIARRLRRGGSGSGVPTDGTDGGRVDGEGLRGRWRKFRSLRTLRVYGAPPPILAPVVHLHVDGSSAERSVAAALPGAVAMVVPGDHISMFDESNSAALAAAMEDWLTRTGPFRPSDRRTVSDVPRPRS